MSTADSAQVASAVFTALAAFAALATVIRAERDRRDRALPDLHVDMIEDRVNQQVRATVVNYGGPAREVRLGGVAGQYGYYGVVGPTSYWRAGESRTVLLGIPLGASDETQTFVEGRDIRMRYVFATAIGGNRKRWRYRPWKKLSPLRSYRHFFPDGPGPLDVPNAPANMETIERAW